jgi:hypothetical protein
MNTIKSIFGLFLMLGIIALTAAPALAIDTTAVVTGITDALTDVETVAVAVLTVLAGIWAIRKLVKLTNRS